MNHVIPRWQSTRNRALIDGGLRLAVTRLPWCSVGVDSGVGVREPTGQCRVVLQRRHPTLAKAGTERRPRRLAGRRLVGTGQDQAQHPARERLRSPDRRQAGVGVAQPDERRRADGPNRSIKPWASSTASWMARFIPFPPAGVMTWAASPATNTRPSCIGVVIFIRRSTSDGSMNSTPSSLPGHQESRGQLLADASSPASRRSCRWQVPRGRSV